MNSQAPITSLVKSHEPPLEAVIADAKLIFDLLADGLSARHLAALVRCIANYGPEDSAG